MKRTIYFFLLLFLTFFSVSAQIYAPEGLNMPGSWDSWSQPPSNLVFAGDSQTVGGKLTLISGLGITHYQTVFSTPTDVVSGTYEFLFSSGPSSNYWQNKWTDADFSINIIDSVMLNGSNNNTITLSDNKYYVMNWENLGYVNTRAIFMELSATPVSITNISQDISAPADTQSVTVTVTTSANPTENVYVRYTTDNWTTSSIIACSFSGTSGTAIIPAQSADTEVEYYVFSTSISNPTADFDLITINFNNNSGVNYTYTVSAPLSCESANGVLTSDPVFPIHDGNVTIIFDATRGNGALMNYTGDIYAHTGVITSASNGNNDWRYVVSDWGENLASLKFTRNLPDSNSWSLSITDIRQFYSVPDSEAIQKIAMVIRSDEPIAPENPDDFYVARNSNGTDFHLSVYNTGLNVKYVGNLDNDQLVPLNKEIPVCIYSLDATSTTLYIDGTQVDQTTDTHLMYALNTGNYTAGTHTIIADATDGTNHAYDTAYFYIRGNVVVEDLPAGVHNGINYIDDNTVTLVLPDYSLAKQFIFVIGDFNNWKATDSGYMKRTPDGKFFWVTLTGLTAGTEYSYQYYIDGELKIADPFCDKILDPWNDRWIPETTYPNLKKYPWDLTLGTVSVLEPGQTPYNWQVADFTPSAVGATQSNLIIYELLIRDFVASRDIKDVMDSLDYLQNLGINAIELMPIAEFEGNDSWGYAPNFYYAPDKAYGTKDDYKAFIDACHQRGIAVILDVVYNHMYGGSPLVQMYWDSNNNQPAANNPWFNQTSPHPYGIGYDLNHESTHTKDLVKDNLKYWMTEYKIDGFRFDLSKGFTNNYTGGDVAAWSQYDQSRINILEDYYDYIKSVNSNAYVILEHFANNDEEQALAGHGCLMWGVENEQFSQTAMGYSTNCDISWASYQERGFTYPNLIPFMESHDEERIAFNALTYGNGFSGDTTAMLKRMQAAAVTYMAIAGPKMIWQFGELGYDESIERCGDGSFSDDCRTSAKPLHWEYTKDYNRQKVYWTYAGMAKLKTENDVFCTGNYGQDVSGLGKRLWFSGSNLNVTTTANFSTTAVDMTPSFQHTGTWYNYFTGETYEVNDVNQTIHYNSGDFYVFTDNQLDKPYANLTFNVKNSSGNNIQNATVSLSGYGAETTDNSGDALFVYGTNTTVNYTVSAAGYTSVTGSVTMTTTDKTENVVLNPTSIDNVQKSSILLYPNPVDDFLTIQSNELYKISVFDLTGKKIFETQMKTLQQNIDLSNLTSGIYTFVFENNQHLEVKKVIVK